MAKKLIVKEINKTTLESINKTIAIEFAVAMGSKNLNSERRDLLAGIKKLEDEKTVELEKNDPKKFNEKNSQIRKKQGELYVIEQQLKALKTYGAERLFPVYTGKGKQRTLSTIGLYESIVGTNLYKEYAGYIKNISGNKYVSMVKDGIVHDSFGIKCNNNTVLNSFCRILTNAVGLRYANNSGILKGERVKEQSEKTFYKVFFGCLVDLLKQGECNGLIIPTEESSNVIINWIKDGENYELQSFEVVSR